MSIERPIPESLRGEHIGEFTSDGKLVAPKEFKALTVNAAEEKQLFDRRSKHFTEQLDATLIRLGLKRDMVDRVQQHNLDLAVAVDDLKKFFEQSSDDTKRQLLDGFASGEMFNVETLARLDEEDSKTATQLITKLKTSPSNKALMREFEDLLT